MNVAGNAAVDSSASLFAWNYWNAANFGPDSEAYVTVASYGASDVIRLGARVTGGTNAHSGYYVAISATGAWSIIRIDNGAVPLTLASGVTQAISSSDKIGIRIVGSIVTALHYTTAAGWIQVLSYNTSSDAVRYTTAGRLALEFRTSTLDNFGGGTLGVQSPTANSSPPTISGSLVDGQTLTTSPGSWTGSPAPTFSYQWKRCDSSGLNCVNIAATSSTYQLAPADVGSTMVVAVTGSNGSGSAGPVSSAATAVVQPATSPPANSSPPTISGSPVDGQTLTASPGNWTGSPAPTFSYQWKRCDSSGLNCVNIAATSSTYTARHGRCRLDNGGRSDRQQRLRLRRPRLLERDRCRAAGREPTRE